MKHNFSDPNKDIYHEKNSALLILAQEFLDQAFAVFSPDALRNQFDFFLSENGINLSDKDYDLVYDHLYDSFESLGSFDINWD